MQHPAMKPFLSLLCASIALLPPLSARADEASHRKSAEALLTQMNMEPMMNQAVDQMLQVQVQQNPQIAPFREQMKTFLSKYMSWASIKDDMVKIYAAEFTEPELKELLAFYQTPVGRKTIERMPALMAKGAEIGQKRVQEHLPELQATIQSQAGAGKKAP